MHLSDAGLALLGTNSKVHSLGGERGALACLQSRSCVPIVGKLSRHV